MPRKFVKRKKTFRRKIRKTRTRPNESRILHLRSNQQMPLPKMLTNSFILEMAGIWDTVGAGIPDPYLNLCISTLLSSSGGPLYCGSGTANRVYGTGTGAGGAFNQGSSSQPTGFASLVAFSASAVSLYSRYTVTGLSYEVTVNPQTQADQCELIILPEINAYSAASKYSNLTEMQNAPYSKHKRCTTNNTVAGNTLKGYISLSKVFGITKSKLLTETGYSGFNDPVGITTPSQNINLIIGCRNNTGSNYTSKTPFGIKLKYYVALSQECGKQLSE